MNLLWCSEPYRPRGPDLTRRCARSVACLSTAANKADMRQVLVPQWPDMRGEEGVLFALLLGGHECFSDGVCCAYKIELYMQLTRRTLMLSERHIMVSSLFFVWIK